MKTSHPLWPLSVAGLAVSLAVACSGEGTTAPDATDDGIIARTYTLTDYSGDLLVTGTVPAVSVDTGTTGEVQFTTLSHDPAHRTCVLEECSGPFDNSEALYECTASKCAFVNGEEWGVSGSPSYQDGTVSFTGTLSYTMPKSGRYVHQRDKVWVGMTVKHDDGREVDFAAKEVLIAELGSPVTLSEHVGDGFTGYAFGVWGDKEAPCRSDRHGCTEYGYTLVSPLGASPTAAYTGASTEFGALSNELRVELQNAGADRTTMVDVKAALVVGLQEEAAAFADGLVLVETGRVETSRDYIEVMYRDTAAEPLARDAQAAIAEALPKLEVRISHWPAANAALVITVGAEPRVATDGAKAHKSKAGLRDGTGPRPAVADTPKPAGKKPMTRPK